MWISSTASRLLQHLTGLPSIKLHAVFFTCWKRKITTTWCCHQHVSLYGWCLHGDVVILPESYILVSYDQNIFSHIFVVFFMACGKLQNTFLKTMFQQLLWLFYKDLLCGWVIVFPSSTWAADLCSSHGDTIGLLTASTSHTVGRFRADIFSVDNVKQCLITCSKYTLVWCFYNFAIFCFY